MRITDVRTVMVAVPFARFGEFMPVTMWYMSRPASIHCVTFIDTDEGITGVGTQGDQHLIMNVIRPKLIGKDPFNIEKIEAELQGLLISSGLSRQIPLPPSTVLYGTSLARLAGSLSIKSGAAR